MGKATNVTNKYYSACRVAERDLSIEKFKARESRAMKVIDDHPENKPTQGQTDEIIVLWNICKRHNLPVTNDSKKPRTYWEASQNIRYFRFKILNGGVSYKLYQAEKGMYYEALRRKRDGNIKDCNT